jgi:iron complex outermembrane receptor protein
MQFNFIGVDIAPRPPGEIQMGTPIRFAGLSRSVLSVYTLACILTCLPVAAQESGLVIEEITVTAQKRTEDLQKVPLSVTAFTSSDADRKGLTSLQALDGQVPGLTVSDNGLFDRVITIRGVGNEAARNRSTISGVAFHIDGIFIASPPGMMQDFLDVERIEVLRGPQGTVFGQNATGGAVNVITRQPVIGEFSGHADVQVGNYDHLNTRAYANIPISDTMAARGSLQYSRHDSFTKNLTIPGAELENDDNLSGRAQLLWQPVDNFSATLRAHFFDTDTGDRAQKNVLDPTKSPRELRQDYEATWKFESKIYSTELKWDLPYATLKSITSFQDDKTRHVRDADRSDGFYLPRTDGPIQDYEFETWTQEINIGSAGEQPLPLDWLLGFFFYDSQIDGSSFEFVDRNNDGIVDHDLFGPERGFSTYVNFFRTSWSVYGQATFHVTDALRLTGGVRYTDDEFKLVNWGFPKLPDPRIVSETAETAVTGRASLEWDILENSMVYGGWSRGYKPGGVNTTLIVGNIVPLQFGSTNVDAYEIGLKSRFFNDRLQLNVAGYYYDYRNLQFPNDDPIPGRGGMDSIPESEVYGFDIEANALLTDTLRLDANFSYNESEITKDKLALDRAAYQAAQQALLLQGLSPFSPQVLAVRAAAVQNVKGSRLPKAPRYILNLTLSHRLNIADHGALTSSVSYRFRDSFPYLVFNNPTDVVPSNHTVDVHLHYQPHRAQWYIEFAAYNVADDDSIQSLNTDIFAVGATSAIYVPPRRLMVRLGYDF